jgi:hypothetical protein
MVGGEAHVAVFNHGVEPSKLGAAKGRNFEPMHIQDLNTPAQGRRPERVDSRDKKIEVYRPRIGGGGNGGGPVGGPGGGHR